MFSLHSMLWVITFQYPHEGLSILGFCSSDVDRCLNQIIMSKLACWSRYKHCDQHVRASGFKGWIKCCFTIFRKRKVYWMTSCQLFWLFSMIADIYYYELLKYSFYLTKYNFFGLVNDALSELVSHFPPKEREGNFKTSDSTSNRQAIYLCL